MLANPTRFHKNSFTRQAVTTAIGNKYNTYIILLLQNMEACRHHNDAKIRKGWNILAKLQTNQPSSNNDTDSSGSDSQKK